MVGRLPNSARVNKKLLLLLDSASPEQMPNYGQVLRAVHNRVFFEEHSGPAAICAELRQLRSQVDQLEDIAQFFGFVRLAE